MNFSIELILTKEYYESFYREWAAQKWLRRAEPYFGVLMILFFGFLHSMDAKHVLGSIPYLFMLAGLYEVFSYFYRRRKWFRARLDSNLLNKKVVIEFGSDSFKSSGPFSQGEVLWTGIKDIRQTPNAVFLIPENRISIYLPKSVFATNEQFLAVVNAKTIAAE